MEKREFLRRQGSKYRAIANYLDIHGFISENEAVALYDLTRSIKSDNPVVAEIGSLVGKSSFILAKGIISRKNPILYCIDPFKATKKTVSTSVLSLKNFIPDLNYKKLFIENMRRNGVFDIVQIMEGHSYEFSNSFPKKIDLLFIDGNHKYKFILRDFSEWSVNIKSGGHIALHDVYFENKEIEGPKRVVQKYLINTPEHNNENWIQQRLIDCLFIARKI